MPRLPFIVVMGVSGSGKSTVGSLLAASLGVPFIDGDDLHPVSSLEKMAAGYPLTDDDRWPWLAAVGDALAAASRTGLVIACSALKRSYRDAIRRAAPEVTFVHLEGSREEFAQRTAARSGHFMPPALLDSQLATLEPLQAEEVGFAVTNSAAPGEVVEAIRAELGW
ncbi:MAG: gluconokinase [Rhodoglobus sp.]